MWKAEKISGYFRSDIKTLYMMVEIKPYTRDFFSFSFSLDVIKSQIFTKIQLNY